MKPFHLRKAHEAAGWNCTICSPKTIWRDKTNAILVVTHLRGTWRHTWKAGISGECTFKTYHSTTLPFLLFLIHCSSCILLLLPRAFLFLHLVCHLQKFETGGWGRHGLAKGYNPTESSLQNSHFLQGNQTVEISWKSCKFPGCTWRLAALSSSIFVADYSAYTLLWRQSHMLAEGKVPVSIFSWIPTPHSSAALSDLSWPQFCAVLIPKIHLTLF